MPTEIGRLQAVITADDRQYRRKMDDADRKAQSTARGIQSAFSKLRLSIPSIGGGFLSGAGGALNVAGGNILTSILGKVTGGMTDAIQVGVNYNKMLEAQSIAFQTLGQSAEQTQKHLADLQALGLKTPFDYQDLVKASLTMNAFGFSMQGRIEDLRKLSDAAAIAAAGTGNFTEALQGIIFALGQMRAKGKVSAEEMNQLAERGIPAWDILARKVGRTKEELQKMAELGKLRGDVAASLLTEGLGQFASGAGDRLSETILGKESNVRDAFQKRASQDTKNLTEAYRNSLDSALKELEQGTGQNLTSTIGDKLAGSLDFITEAITGKISSTELLGALKLTGAQMWESIQQGFTGAISAGSATAIDAIKGWAGGVIDSAKKALGIQSPSKIFAEIGQDTIAGFAMGLEAGKKKQQKPIIDVEAMRKRLLEELTKLRDDPKIQALLKTISFAEGANYNTLFGGGTFSSYAAHPNEKVTAKLGGQDITSTAAGAYQILKRIDDALSKRTGLSDFSPETQDIKAIALMKEKNAIQPLLEGDFATAIDRLKKIWASLPDSPFGQPTKKLEDLTEKYNAALEELTGQTMATSTAVKSLTDAIIKVDLASQSLTIRGSDGASQKPYLGQIDAMTIKAPQALEPLASIPETFRRLSMDTTLAKRAMETLPPPLTQVAQTAPQAASGMAAVTKASKDQIDALLSATSKFGTAASRFGEFKDRLGQNFDDLIGALFEGGDRWKDAAKNVAVDFFNSLASEMMLAATGGKYGSIGGLLGGIVGGLFGGFFHGGKAGGGPVKKGGMYLVGEQGPELFAPPRSGHIVPADQTRRMMKGMKGMSPFNEKIVMALMGYHGGSGPFKAGSGLSPFNNLMLGALVNYRSGAINPGADGLFGMAGNALFKRRASGGPVTGGHPYLVGELGPEAYMPGGSTSAGKVYNITINVPVVSQNGAVTPQTRNQIASQTAQALQAALSRNG